MYGDMTSRTRMGSMEAFARGVPAELTTFVKKTYGLLAFSLALGVAACLLSFKFLPVVKTAYGLQAAFAPWILWALWGGTFLFGILGGMAGKGARSGEASPFGLLCLVGLVVCSGAMLGPTIQMYVGLGMGDVVWAAAVTTAVTFTALTSLVFVTGKNFSFLGGFLCVAGLAFFVAWMIAIFFLGPNVQWWLSAFGAVLFCGYILFHTSSVVHHYGPQNLVVPAVIALYLDIFNLFVLLLRLFAGNRRN